MFLHGWLLLRKWTFTSPQDQPGWDRTPFQAELCAKYRDPGLAGSCLKTKASILIKWTTMFSGGKAQRDQVRPGCLSTTLSASCDLFPGFHSALSIQTAADSAQCCLVPREVSHHLQGLSASQSYPGLPARAAGSRLPTASLTPSSSPALAQPSKASFPELNPALPRQQSPPLWCRLCLLQERHTTANRSTKQTNAVSCRNVKLLFNEPPFITTNWVVSLLKQVPGHGWLLPKGSIRDRTPGM